MKERQNWRSLQLPANNGITGGVNAMDLAPGFATSGPTGATVFIQLPSNCDHLIGSQFFGASAPAEGAAHSIKNQPSSTRALKSAAILPMEDERMYDDLCYRSYSYPKDKNRAMRLAKRMRGKSIG